MGKRKMAYMTLACMLCIVGYATGISTTQFYVCKNNGSFPSVNIDCYNNGIIHIESIQYFYNNGSYCNIGKTCSQPLTNSDTGLISNCTGQSSCYLYIPNDNNCTGSNFTFRCIARKNVQDMCQKNLELKQSDSIFLSSPQYPELVNGLPVESCECSIRGTSITSITILVLILNTSSDGVRSNLFIQYGDIKYNQTSRNISQSFLQVYNHILQTTTTIPPTTAGITFTHKQIHGQKLWIEIQGGDLNGFCNKQTTSTYSSSTHTDISTSTTAYPTSAANNHMTPSETSPGTSSGLLSNTLPSPTDSGIRQTDDGISTTISSVCKNNGSFPTPNIGCFNNSIIHIENIQYFYNQGSNCNTKTCGQPLTNSDTGLISTCTGQPSPCLQDIPNNNNCTGSAVTYRCIERENIRNICAKDFELKQSDSIFLSSPQYPELVNGLPGQSCECSIRGTSITSITILYLTLKTSNDGVRSNLFIQYGNITYNQTSGDNSQIPFQVYNHRLQTTTPPPATAADIIFTHRQINEQKLWVEIQGTSLTGVCNNISRTPTTSFVSSSNNLRSDTSTHLPSTRTAAPGASVDYISSVPTSKPATSPTDSGPQQTDNDVVIIVVISILSLSLVLVIVLGLLYRRGKLKCLKQPGNPGAENPRTITQLEPSSNYSNLSDVTRNNKDNTYQELQTRNSNSPYTNLPYTSSSEMEAGTN